MKYAEHAAHLASGGVQDGSGGRGRPPGDFLVGFEPRRLHGVLLGLHHPNDPLLGPRVVGHALLRRSVPERG